MLRPFTIGEGLIILIREYNKSWNDINKVQELGHKIPPEFLDDLRKASGREK